VVLISEKLNCFAKLKLALPLEEEEILSTLNEFSRCLFEFVD
jgi:hypothetical protein